MKKLGLVLFVFSVFAFVSGTTKLIKKLEIVDLNQTYFDNLSNVYTVANNEIVKYDSEGKPFSKYSDKTWGAIHQIDVSNPLKIIVFFKDFSKIIFLDNMLGQTGSTIFLEKLGLEQTQLICSSHNNGIWVFNQLNFELIRLAQTLEITNRTGNLGQILGIDITPNFMLQYNNFLYVNNPETGILVFDSFGTYYKTIPIKGLNTFQVRDDDIIFSQKNKIGTFNLKTLKASIITEADTGLIKASIEKNRILLQYNNYLEVKELQ